MTKEQAKQWLIDNKNYVTHSQKFTQEKINEMYQAYNTLTGDNKQPSNCGACLLNTKKILQKHLIKIEKEPKVEEVKAEEPKVEEPKKVVVKKRQAAKKITKKVTKK
jgi:bacterioferritin-associated ferredoxin